MIDKNTEGDGFSDEKAGEDWVADSADSPAAQSFHAAVADAVALSSRAVRVDNRFDEASRPDSVPSPSRGGQQIARRVPLPAPLPSSRSDRWPRHEELPVPVELPAVPQQVPTPASPASVVERFPSLPPLPGRRRRSSRGGWISFVLCVLIPTGLVGIYYGFFAANQYLAEFRFSVVQTNPVLVGQPPQVQSAGSLVSGLSSMLGGTSISDAGTQNFVVVDYLTSREAVDELQRRIQVQELYSRPQADWWARFDPREPMEKFLDYWQTMVTANYDQVTGLATAQVRAFTPQDADLIAKTLVSLSEELVNGIADRANKDAVKYAQDEANRQENNLKQVRAALTKFRSEAGIIDPTQSLVPTNVQQIGTLEASLIQLKTQLATLGNQRVDVNSPTSANLRAQIIATQSELDRVRGQVSTKHDNDKALTDVMARYEQLNLDVQYAQNLVMGTMQALDQARANAAAQHLYLTPYVRPALPTSSTYPKRLQSTLLVGLMCFGVWLAGLLVFRSIREHSA